MNKKYTIILLIVSFISTVLAACLFVFFMKVIKNKNEHTSIVLTTLEEKMKEKENAKIFAEKIAETKTFQSQINNYFVNPNQIDTFVSYLEDMGNSIGSKVLVNSIEVPTKTKNVISFKLSISGSFNDIMKTITFLENIPYQVNITQVYLNKELEQPNTEEGMPIIKAAGVSAWTAGVSFNVLSLN